MKLGGTVEELMDRMSAKEFGYWREFYRREPWGYHMDNLRMGVIASASANAPHVLMKQLAKPADFYPAQKKPAKKQRPQLTARQREQLENRKHANRRNDNR